MTLVPQASTKKKINTSFPPPFKTRKTSGKKYQQELVNDKVWKKGEAELKDALRIPDYRAKE